MYKTDLRKGEKLAIGAAVVEVRQLSSSRVRLVVDAPPEQKIRKVLPEKQTPRPFTLTGVRRKP